MNRMIDALRNQLANQGLQETGRLLHNLPPALLYEEIVRRQEGCITNNGAVVVQTGRYTGRSPNDRFVVDEPSSRHQVAWGRVNQPFDEERYMRLRSRMLAYLQRRDLFVQDVCACHHPQHRRRVRLVTELAWHALFARNLFINGSMPRDTLAIPDLNIIAAPHFAADPKQDGTNSEAFIILHPGRREVLIGATHYAGENKKSIFSMLNYLLPQEGVLPMHCSANVGERGNVAIFFGLSGTGKTTLSTDVHRRMIGDDEHGWGPQGVFNFEGGCYAKAIRLSAQAEPEIWACTRRFGTVLENVVCHPETRELDLDSEALTENTRAAYPLAFLDNIQPDSQGGHPEHVIMLTADAFGVLPPVARLTPDQAMYHFLSGYTAKLAGTERGIKDPVASFSSCFGEPFMVQDPTVYATMLGERLAQHGSRCWLVNTGWTGGPFGEGSRMPIQETRNIVNRILANELDTIPTREDSLFRFQVPLAIPAMSSNLMQPRQTWRDGEAYDYQARQLAKRFADNFTRHASKVSLAVRESGPSV
ncbi:MAG: phosphoenolpyruvate carboxykinase (ATP) [Magnetococcales bacterium]|nr:phosphoenolpyruvate carboxykinase (ATP) [Magnetococcales bacterium]